MQVVGSNMKEFISSLILGETFYMKKKNHNSEITDIY